jgi:hypothetical protein
VKQELPSGVLWEQLDPVGLNEMLRALSAEQLVAEQRVLSVKVAAIIDGAGGRSSRAGSQA